MKTKILALGFLAILSMVSCSKNEKDTDPRLRLTQDEASVNNAKIDNIASDDVAQIVETEFEDTPPKQERKTGRLVIVQQVIVWQLVELFQESLLLERS